MTGYSDEFEFEKELTIDVEVDLDFEVDVDWDVDYDIYTDICIDPSVDGNSAFLSLDVQALGYDTFTDANVAILTVENTMSSITVQASSIVE